MMKQEPFLWENNGVIGEGFGLVSEGRCCLGNIRKRMQNQDKEF